MAINFDQLPTSIDGGYGTVIPKGTYFASIERAEMKKPKSDPTKPEYLNMMLKIKDKDGKEMGIIWDIISESTNQYAQFKLRRFAEALGIKIVPGLSLELKDLAKIATGVKMIVDISQDKENKNQIDIFSGDVYYHISETNTIFGTEGLFVDATDAEDAGIFDTAPTTDENIEY